jgi:hypothetical protein
MEEYIYIIIICIILFIMFGIFIFFIVRNKNIESLKDPISACINTCNEGWENCQQACTNINGDNGCQLSCELLYTQCTNNCYPDVYALRNATPWTLYFFRSSGTLIGSRIGTSPYRLVVQASDFPIIATYCSDLKNNGCDYTNIDFGMTITDPGCYIVWYDQGYYTTAEVCSKS